MKEYVHNLWPKTLPGESTAFLARYLGVTRDEFALNIIKTMMKNPTEGNRYKKWRENNFKGLAPHNKVPLTVFMLYYFQYSTLPVKELFQDEILFMLKIGNKGLGISGYEGIHPDLDTDMSAVCNIVFAKLGFSAPVPAEQFDKWWIEAILGYEFIGNAVYIPEHTVNVLEAILLVEKKKLMFLLF